MSFKTLLSCLPLPHFFSPPLLFKYRLNTPFSPHLLTKLATQTSLRLRLLLFAEVTERHLRLHPPMARALSTSSLSKTIFSDAIPLLAQTQRRGLAAAAEAARRSPKAEEKAAVAQLLAGKRAAGAANPDPWVPDPVTGYYRPSNRVVEVDAAELRAMLLRPKA